MRLHLHTVEEKAGSSAVTGLGKDQGSYLPPADPGQRESGWGRPGAAPQPPAPSLRGWGHGTQVSSRENPEESSPEEFVNSKGIKDCFSKFKIVKIQILRSLTFCDGARVPGACAGLTLTTLIPSSDSSAGR